MASSKLKNAFHERPDLEQRRIGFARRPPIEPRRHMGFALPDSTAERLRDLAATYGVSMTQVLVALIEKEPLATDRKDDR